MPPTAGCRMPEEAVDIKSCRAGAGRSVHWSVSSFTLTSEPARSRTWKFSVMASIDANVNTARDHSHTCTPKSVTITGPCYRCWDTTLSRLPQNLSVRLGPKGSGGNEEKDQHTRARPPVWKFYNKRHGGRGHGVESERDSEQKGMVAPELIATRNHHFHFGRLVFGCWEAFSAGTDIITQNIFRCSQLDRRFPTLGY